MKYYIVPDENARYYSRRNIGIFKAVSGGRCEAELIVKGGCEGFGLYRDDTTHIICADQENNIIYSQSGRQPFTVISGKADVRPYDFTLTSINGFLDLFYKTDFENNTFLFHCMLGSSEKPYAVSQLSKEHTGYCIGGGRAYFTSAKDGFGYVDMTHGKPREHIKICDCADDPCCVEACGELHMTYTDDGSVFVDSKSVISDRFAEKPVLFFQGGKYILQWLSGGKVKYSVSSDCETWSAPMRYIGSEREPCIIEFAQKNNVYRCYGSVTSPYSSPKGDVERELEEIKQQLDKLKKEIKKLNSTNYFTDFERK